MARGPLLAILAASALILGQPSPRSILLGAGLALAPLALRAWAFAHLGGQGRTRDPAPPSARVRSGPYGRLSHPVYIANLGLAVAMLVAAAPPWAAGSGLGITVAAFYGLLAAREGAQLVDLPAVRRRPTWRRVPRWERSTWATTAAWFALLLARSA